MSQAWASTSIQLDQRLMRALKSILPTTLSSSPTTRSSSWKERDQGKKPSITLTSGQNSITQELRKAIKGARVEPLSIWHQRFGHLNNKSLLKMASMGSVKGLALFKDQPYSSDHCRGCLQGKMCRVPFISTRTKTTGVGQVIHSDVCGPMHVPTPTGERYYVAFKDDFSGWTEIKLIKNKCEVPNAFKNFAAKVETDTGKKVKTFSPCAQSISSYLILLFS